MGTGASFEEAGWSVERYTGWLEWMLTTIVLGDRSGAEGVTI